MREQPCDLHLDPAAIALADRVRRDEAAVDETRVRGEDGRLARGRDGVRWVAEIGLLERDRDGLVHVATAVALDPAGRPAPGPASPRLDALLGRAP